MSKLVLYKAIDGSAYNPQGFSKSKDEIPTGLRPRDVYCDKEGLLWIVIGKEQKVAFPIISTDNVKKDVDMLDYPRFNPEISEMSWHEYCAENPNAALLRKVKELCEEADIDITPLISSEPPILNA